MMSKCSARIICLFILLTCPIYSFAQFADKRIGILVYEGVLTSDVTAPLEVFGIASRESWFSDYEVITIGIEDNTTITTEEGLRLGVDTWIGDSLKTSELDILLVPSRYEMKSLLNNEQLIAFIAKVGNQVEWLTSNCSGAYLLAEAGLLNGKKATTWAGGENDLQDQYPAIDVQVDTNIVIDGNVLTSNGSLVSYQAALTLLSLMSSKSRAAEVADTLQYSRFSTKEF